MPDSVFPPSPIRNLKDLRVAVRHGEAVVVRQLHASVIASVAAAVASVNSASSHVVQAETATDVYQRVEDRASLARDATRLSAAVTGIAVAVWFTGEIITTQALTMLALLPAVVMLTKTSETSATLKALGAKVRRVEHLRSVVDSRHVWLLTVSRAAKLLTRTLSQPHALYETPCFGSTVRVMRRRVIRVDQIERLEDALSRASKVEDVVAGSRFRMSACRSGIRATAVKAEWSNSTFFWRRVLLAAAVVAASNAMVLALTPHPLAAVLGGLLCSALLIIRYIICEVEVRRLDAVIRRDLLRLRYPDLLRYVDNTIQEEIDNLITLYALGLDVKVNPFEDIEPQLRRQIDNAIAYGRQSEKQLHDVLDLRPLRDTHRPSSN